MHGEYFRAVSGFEPEGNGSLIAPPTTSSTTDTLPDCPLLCPYITFCQSSALKVSTCTRSSLENRLLPRSKETSYSIQMLSKKSSIQSVNTV